MNSKTKARIFLPLGLCLLFASAAYFAVNYLPKVHTSKTNLSIQTKDKSVVENFVAEAESFLSEPSTIEDIKEAAEIGKENPDLDLKLVKSSNQDSIDIYMSHKDPESLSKISEIMAKYVKDNVTNRISSNRKKKMNAAKAELSKFETEILETDKLLKDVANKKLELTNKVAEAIPVPQTLPSPVQKQVKATKRPVKIKGPDDREIKEARKQYDNALQNAQNLTNELNKLSKTKGPLWKEETSLHSKLSQQRTELLSIPDKIRKSSKPKISKEAETVRHQLAEEQEKLSKLFITYKEKHPKVIECNKNITKLKTQLKSFDSGVVSEVVSPNPKKEKLKNQIKENENSLKKVQSRLKSIEKQESELGGQMSSALKVIETTQKKLENLSYKSGLADAENAALEYDSKTNPDNTEDSVPIKSESKLNYPDKPVEISSDEKSKIKKYDDEINQLNRQLESLEEERHKAKHKLETIRQQHSSNPFTIREKLQSPAEYKVSGLSSSIIYLVSLILFVLCSSAVFAFTRTTEAEERSKYRYLSESHNFVIPENNAEGSQLVPAQENNDNQTQTTDDTKETAEEDPLSDAAEEEIEKEEESTDIEEEKGTKEESSSDENKENKEEEAKEEKEDINSSDEVEKPATDTDENSESQDSEPVDTASEEKNEEFAADEEDQDDQDLNYTSFKEAYSDEQPEAASESEEYEEDLAKEIKSEEEKEKENEQAVIKLENKILFEGKLTPTKDDLETLLFAVDKLESNITKTYKKVLPKLQIQLSNTASRIIIPITVKRGVGQSTWLANTAVLTAQAGYSVLMVDCCTEHPMLHKIFNLKNEPGLLNVFEGDLRKTTQKTHIKDLNLISSGKSKKGDTRITANKLKAVLQVARRKSDVIFVDLPCSVTIDVLKAISDNKTGFVYLESPSDTEAEKAEIQKNFGHALVGYLKL